MAKNAFDYSRLVRACGYADRPGDEKEINQRVLHFLNQRFSVTIAEFNGKLADAQKELQVEPLKKYRKFADFEIAWQLINAPMPLKDWDFLSYVDPEKTGILCGKSGEQSFLLTKENTELEIFDSPEAKYGHGADDLCYNLSWWREAVCCVWAGIIMNGLIHRFQKKSILALPVGEPTFSKDGFADPNEPIGKALELAGVSDKEADDFYKLYERAMLGSAYCEYDAGEAFKEFLSSTNIMALQKHNLNFKESHALLLAGSQRRPEVEIELRWNQNARAYQFVCLIENNDVHGYKDKEKIATIPASILFDFFKGAEPKIQQDLIRLLIRGGCDKARNFLFLALVSHLD